MLVLAGAGVFWYVDPFHLWSPPASYDVSTSPVSLLPPGTVIGETAPEGWTHLILKSRPSVSSGAVSRLSEHEVRYATFLFMTTVARVSARHSSLRTTYVLDDVAIGLGTQIDGKDVVLSPDTHDRLGANLGFIFRMILSGAYQKQKAVRVVARSPTFALLDTPAMMLRHGKHVEVILRYAVLVEPHTGRLDTLVYLIDRADKPEESLGPIEWLPPDLLIRAPLHIDDREFLLGNPTEKSYGVECIPQGQQHLDIPDDLKHLAGQRSFTEPDAQRLHASLRQLLKSTPKR